MKPNRKENKNNEKERKEKKGRKRKKRVKRKRKKKEASVILHDNEINLQSFALDITKLIDIESDTEYCLHNFLLRSSSLNFTKF
jgi:hypothetical protein